MDLPQLDSWHMRRALELASQGLGRVEPNPLVGCVVTQGAEIIGEGWHAYYGGPHAEVEALAVAGSRAAGGTLYVTLEPCCHFGKTPPCTRAVLAAGIRRVVVAQLDPFPAVAGQGVAELRAGGLQVDVGAEVEAARWLNAPYRKLLSVARPWMIAKWAMTLDGKIACRTGHSRWISGESARNLAHALRGRVDAVMIGRGTALADDPLLTARPAGTRMATRIVLDSLAALPSDSRLVTTARDVPVLVATGPQADPAEKIRLQQAGCEIFVCGGDTHAQRLDELLVELGRRRMTNVLVEGGAALLGSLFDGRHIDEVHAVVAPKLIGGIDAASPLGGLGVGSMAEAIELQGLSYQHLDGDICISGRLEREIRKAMGDELRYAHASNG